MTDNSFRRFRAREASRIERELTEIESDLAAAELEATRLCGDDDDPMKSWARRERRAERAAERERAQWRKIYDR